MSEQLSDVRARIGATRQLETVITAMRSIAAARSREAEARLDGVRAYAGTLGTAIGEAIALAPDAPTFGPPASHIVLALCAEQGFAGAFSERVLDAAARRLKNDTRGADLFLVGGRGLALAAERKLNVAWSWPMAAHIDEAGALADRIASALYDRLGDGQSTRITMVHSAPGPSGIIEIVERPLVPLDFARFPASSRLLPPLATLPPLQLLARLAEEYMFAELYEAVVLSFAAENEARMQAMIVARHNVRKMIDDLMAKYRRIRQEEITNEIIELASR